MCRKLNTFALDLNEFAAPGISAKDVKKMNQVNEVNMVNKMNMMIKEETVKWLLEGDVSIQFQVYRDLLDQNIPDLQARIEKEGWAVQLLEARRPDGHWGLKFYQPKWTSSHYTLLDLRNLNISPAQKLIIDSIEKIAREEKGADGGINPSGSISKSDVCINGMFLNYACYFGIDEELLKSVVDFILSQLMPDGAFNCRLNRSGAKHSSMHTTINTLEGIEEYKKNKYSYRLKELVEAQKSAESFLLLHKLYKSDKSGETIHDSFLKMPYPSRWYYNILRALDYFRYSKAQWNDALLPSIDRLMCKRTQSGRWKLNAKYPGKRQFEMEKAGMPSRWNTLMALRVLKHFRIQAEL